MALHGTGIKCYWEHGSVVSGKCLALLYTSQILIHVHFSDLEILVWGMLMSYLTSFPWSPLLRNRDDTLKIIDSWIS